MSSAVITNQHVNSVLPEILRLSLNMFRSLLKVADLAVVARWNRMTSNIWLAGWPSTKWRRNFQSHNYLGEVSSMYVHKPLLNVWYSHGQKFIKRHHLAAEWASILPLKYCQPKTSSFMWSHHTAMTNENHSITNCALECAPAKETNGSSLTPCAENAQIQTGQGLALTTFVCFVWWLRNPRRHQHTQFI